MYLPLMQPLPGKCVRKRRNSTGTIYVDTTMSTQVITLSHYLLTPLELPLSTNPLCHVRIYVDTTMSTQVITPPPPPPPPP